MCLDDDGGGGDDDDDDDVNIDIDIGSLCMTERLVSTP